MAKEVEPVACSMTAMIQTFVQIIRLFYDGVLSFPTQTEASFQKLWVF